ncbi:MAG: cobalamin-independent methionine synthase II family protein [Deltaproteobacteria bacterium]
MKISNERFITTHVGSLARPVDLLDIMVEKEHGRPYDKDAFEAAVTKAVHDIVAQQVDSGIDVVTDGEMSKVDFFTYVRDRLSGYTTQEDGPGMTPESWLREVEAFPEYYERYMKKYEKSVSPLRPMMCTGPVEYVGHDDLQRDLRNLKSALEKTPAAEAFLPATSPFGFGKNEHYEREEDYVAAVGEALRVEYQAIVDAGFILQVDDPWLIEILNHDPKRSREERRKAAERHVEGVNHALRGIPADKVRYHICYGLNMGPRVHDAPMEDFVDLMLRVNASAYSFEVANPRHQHEWRIWEEHKLPDDKILVPGFISHSIPFIEHPRGIADSIAQYTKLVGRERIIVGADCGFSSRASYRPELPPRVVWAKFKALSEGARLASTELFD